MKYMKSKYRLAISYKHFELILKMGTSNTNIELQFDKILTGKFHTFH